MSLWYCPDAHWTGLCKRITPCLKIPVPSGARQRDMPMLRPISQFRKVLAQFSEPSAMSSSQPCTVRRKIILTTEVTLMTSVGNDAADTVRHSCLSCFQISVATKEKSLSKAVSRNERLLRARICTELAKKVSPGLRDSACWRSGEITQPRTNFFGQLSS